MARASSATVFFDENEDKLKVPANAEEFEATFDLLDKNSDGNLTKDEIRYIMNGMGYELNEDEIRDLMVDIGGPQAQAIDKAHFLHFCSTMTEGDVDNELKECFKITSAMTDTLSDGRTKKTEMCVTAMDVDTLFKKIGGDITLEEAEELLQQADVNNVGHLRWDEFINLLSLPGKQSGD